MWPSGEGSGLEIESLQVRILDRAVYPPLSLPRLEAWSTPCMKQRDATPWLVRQNSPPQHPGFDPLAGQGEERHFLCPPVSTLCADLRIPHPETLASIPWRGRVRDVTLCVPPCQLSVVQTCLCLTPFRVYGTHQHVCAC